MFSFANLLKDGLPFGGRSWVAMVLWVIGLIAGLYLYQGWREANPVRLRFARRTGLGLAIASGLGLLVLILRAVGVPVLSKPIWGYLVFIGTLAYLAYAFYFYTQQLPRLVAATRGPARRSPQQAQVQRGGARTYAASAKGDEARPAAPTRPLATTTRREARRDKKRKSR